jgi:hypothetical protein
MLWSSVLIAGQTEIVEIKLNQIPLLCKAKSLKFNLL